MFWILDSIYYSADVNSFSPDLLDFLLRPTPDTFYSWPLPDLIVSSKFPELVVWTMLKFAGF